MIDFPKQQYIGVQGGKEFSVASYPLAYMTPNGKDAAFEKRKANVDYWASNYDRIEHFQGVVIDNAAQEGFVILDWSTRSITDNKHVVIGDPRGFSLEIDIQNLIDILLVSNVSMGKLEGRFIWGRRKGLNVLCREEESLKEIKPAEPFDQVTFVKGKGTYLGLVSVKIKDDHMRSGNISGNLHAILMEDGGFYNGRIYLQKTKPKMATIGTRNVIDLSKEYTLFTANARANGTITPV